LYKKARRSFKISEGLFSGKAVGRQGLKMATMIGLFSAIGEHIPIFRENKITEATAEGMINRSVK
jgi:hypothetical protein